MMQFMDVGYVGKICRIPCETRVMFSKFLWNCNESLVGVAMVVVSLCFLNCR